MRIKGAERGTGNFAQRQPSGAALCRLFLRSFVPYLNKQAGSQTNAAGVLLSNGPAAAYRRAATSAEAPIQLVVQEEYLQNAVIIH